MNYKIPLALMMCSAFTVDAAEQPVWRAIAFGQSTDLNFSSNVLPEKVGVNDVTIDGNILTEQETADLTKPIVIESRGGKIANSHDGLTFFYTALPTSENFTLQATIKVEQFGPENGAKPAAQEGAGLLVRDVIGIPRQRPLKEGYEEFPAASNMVMNAIMTQDKKDHHRIKLQAITREGISRPGVTPVRPSTSRATGKRWILTRPRHSGSGSSAPTTGLSPPGRPWTAMSG